MISIVSHIVAIDGIVMYLASRVHVKSHFDFEQYTWTCLTDQMGHYPAEEAFPHRGRGRLNLREENAHDGFLLVPSSDVRFADARCKGFEQYAVLMSTVRYHHARNVKTHKYQGLHRAFRTLPLKVEHLVEVGLVEKVFIAFRDNLRLPAVGC